MLRIRRFEEKAAELYSLGKIRGFLHLYIGEEAVAVGAMQALGDEDAIVATYRDHGHALARGLPPGALMAEMFGKANGCSRGRGGSMHFFDVVAALLRRLRDRRRRAADRGRPRPRRQAAGTPARHRLLLRRRRGRRGRVPRVAEPRRAVAPAGALPVREQPLRDGDGARARRRRSSTCSCARSGYGVPGRGRRRHGRPRRRGGGARPAWIGPRGGGPHLLELSHVPLPRALDGRPRPLPDEGRDRALEAARSDLALRGAPARGGPARRRRAGRARGRDVAAEIEAAVAFAEAGPWEPVEDLAADVTRPAGP